MELVTGKLKKLSLLRARRLCSRGACKEGKNMLIIHFYTLTCGYDGFLKDFGLVTQLKSIGPQKYAILIVGVAIPTSKYPTIRHRNNFGKVSSSC